MFHQNSVDSNLIKERMYMNYTAFNWYQYMLRACNFNAAIYVMDITQKEILVTQICNVTGCMIQQKDTTDILENCYLSNNEVNVRNKLFPTQIVRPDISRRTNNNIWSFSQRPFLSQNLLISSLNITQLAFIFVGRSIFTISDEDEKHQGHL